MTIRQRLAALAANPQLVDILVGSAIDLFIKGISGIALFGMSMLIARQLGAAESGVFFLILTLITVTAAFSRLGLDQAIVRLVSAAKSKQQWGHVIGIYRQAIQWVMLASCLLASIIWLSADWLNSHIFSLPNFTAVMRWGIIAMPLLALFTMHAQALQGLQKITFAMLTLNVLMPVGLLALLLTRPADSALVASQYLVMSCFLALLLGYLFWRRQGLSAKKIECLPARQLGNICRPLWVVVMLAQVVQWSPQLLLGVWSTPEDVAYFATAQRTAMLTSLVLIAVNSIAAPKFAALYAQGDYAGLQQVSLWSVRLLLLTATPILLVMLLFPGWLMSFFGESFRAAASALSILAVGQFVNIACGSVGYLLSMTGHEKVLRNNAIISALSGLALGLLLIPYFALLGATIAASVAISIQNLLGVYQVRKHLGFNTLVFW